MEKTVQSSKNSPSHRRPANVIADLNLFHKRVGGEGKGFPSIENLKKDT